MGLLTKDPEHNIVSFNKFQSAQNKNGSYTFVLSSQDPGIYNWIDTTNLERGTLMIRWQGLPAGDGTAKDIQVHSQLVKYENLHNVLPDDVPKIDQGGRSEQIEKRRQEYKRIHFQN